MLPCFPVGPCLVGEAMRGHVPRAELLSSTFAAQGPGRRIRNVGRERRENEAWVREATAAATRERMTNYAAR